MFLTHIGNMAVIAPLKASLRAFFKTYSEWGRMVDRDVYSDAAPAENPDPIDAQSSGDRYFQISQNPYIAAGLRFRNAPDLFVSAKGLDPDENGAYFPPQLIYTQTEGQNQEQFDALANQYDEDFDGGFAPILGSLLKPALVYGRAIGEIDWQRDDDGRIGARFIWSRDPEEYLINPPGYKPGIYQKQSLSSSATSGDIVRMPDGKFIHIAFNPLFNNPYGSSILRPLALLTESWTEFYEAWRKGVKNAGYGMIRGEYGATMRGESTRALAMKAQAKTELAKFKTDNVLLHDEDLKIFTELIQINDKALLDYHEAYVEAASVILTGSATALKEGKYGTYAEAESTDVREKSDIQKSDALLLGLAFTSQFNPVFLHRNFFPNVQLIPQLQFIRPERIMPVTPAGQDTQESLDIQSEPVTEFQAESPDPDAYFSDEPEPDIYFRVQEKAREFLRTMPVKNYSDVRPGEEANTFTVKRLRSFPDAVEIQTQLLGIIVETIGMKTEQEAWRYYWAEAKNVFKALGYDTGMPEHEMLISFRQARQNAYQAGINALIESNSDQLYAIRIETRGDSDVRLTHKVWNGIVLAPDDERLQQLACPMDFGCRCNQIPVWQEERLTYPITPENEIPTIFPGESYKYYVV